jgi:hypothetical protein
LPEPSEMQTGTEPIAGIVAQSLAERGGRRRAIAQPDLDLAKPEPSRRKPRRRFDRLPKQIGGGGEVAALGEIAAILVAPVGDQIAGGIRDGGLGIGSQRIHPIDRKDLTSPAL